MLRVVIWKTFLVFQPGTQMFSLSLSQSWKTYFSPSSFIHLSVSLITFLLKNGLNMYIDGRTSGSMLCYLERALTREQTNNKSFTVYQRRKSDFIMQADLLPKFPL